MRGRKQHCAVENKPYQFLLSPLRIPKEFSHDLEMIMWYVCMFVLAVVICTRVKPPQDPGRWGKVRVDELDVLTGSNMGQRKSML